MDYQLGLYEKALPNDMTIAEKLTIAKRVGFDFMEISIDESAEKLARLNYSQSQKKELCRTIADIGLPVKSICLSALRKYPLGSKEPAIVSRSFEIIDQAIDLGCELGVRTIQLAGYDVYYEISTDESRKRYVNNLHNVVCMAAKAEMMLGFETMETEFMDTIQKAMVYINEIRSPYLQIYPDTGNLTNAMKKYDGDFVMDAQAGQGHILAAHLKETMPGHYRNIPFGSGYAL
ncbi:MAG TPA: L-ribulose-5-phosphate 3-epimerase [Clostridiales bacterium]|nr:L-ribulose-5-phosphate 3-epimerase [Clostridiales bacterium]